MENFMKGFLKQASFKSEILYRLSRGLPVKLKGISKRSLRSTSIGKRL